MKKLSAICLIFTLLFGLTFATEARDEKRTPGVKTPGVKTRQKVQSKRIKGGVRSGALTKDEAASVMKDEKEIREDKREARADGTVTGAERKEIHQEQNQASRKIYRKKHNSRTRN